MTWLVWPGLAVNAQTPASGTTRLPSCTLVPSCTGPALPIGSRSARATVSSAAGSALSAPSFSRLSAWASSRSRCAPATSIGIRMWRPLALSPLRLVTSIR